MTDNFLVELIADEIADGCSLDEAAARYGGVVVYEEAKEWYYPTPTEWECHADEGDTLTIDDADTANEAAREYVDRGDWIPDSDDYAVVRVYCSRVRIDWRGYVSQPVTTVLVRVNRYPRQLRRLR